MTTKEPLWRAVLRELLTTLAHEIGEMLPGLILRWARRRWGIDPLTHHATATSINPDEQHAE